MKDNNSIIIKEIKVEGNRISCEYDVIGTVKDFFKLDQTFFVEYSIDVSSVPKSIAIVPLLANILPVSWVCDAEIVVPSCDKTFYDSLENIKNGYKNMFPTTSFKGKLTVGSIEENQQNNNKGSVAFFSGGVDAFNTLVNHADEHPTLITLWGSDVQHSDEKGWANVINHLNDTSLEFGVDYLTAKTSFRMILNEKKLDEKIALSGDQWFHGFQCGMGIICHAAPVAYIMHKDTIYFASSYTSTDVYTSASDPTIDNHVRFGSSHVSHDGYEYSRQMKVHNIVEFCKKQQCNVFLRVCWATNGGGNCCVCEKCWRTILALYAEKVDPKKFGFNYADFSSLCKQMHKQAYKFKGHGTLQFYSAIIQTLHDNYRIEDVDPNLRWFYKIKIEHLGEMPFYYYILRDLRIYLGTIKYKINTCLKRLPQ